MEISKKPRSKNLSDHSLNKKKYSAYISNYFPAEKKKTSACIKDLSLNLTNSIKNLSHNNSAPKINLSSIYSPKYRSSYIPCGSNTKRMIKNNSNTSLHASSTRNSNQLVKTEFPVEGKICMPSRMALNYFKPDLTEYEKSEILEYQDVYYLGKITNKIKTNPSGINYGYDDDRGDYLLIAGDHIAYRYEIIKMLGKGNFGQVVLCEDHKRQEMVAVKLVRNKKRFNQQATVEIKILQTLRENDVEGKFHVVKIKNYFVFRKHICMTFDQLSMNLYELLHQNKFEGFSLNLIHKFIYQILVCLNYTFKFDIIHCDLKPENVMLVNQHKAEINVIDFGSSCFEEERLYTYIQSRFYRAPEIILGIPYTPAIDM